MNQKWKTVAVSTPEETFDKIKKELPQPVGIVLFGADCDFKNEVYHGYRKGGIIWQLQKSSSAV